jgi:glycine/D-amino acid oxidase-like deaminating enzyme
MIRRPDDDAYEAGAVPIVHSGWVAGDVRAWPALKSDIDVDVAVVGAGVVGASVALHLAERGVRVALIEARQPGDGASGRNAGQVLPYLGKLVDRASWPDRGERLLDYFVQHRNIVFDLCERHGIDADAAPCGMVGAAYREYASMTKNVRYWRGLGYDVDVVDRGRLRELLGTDRYSFGVHWREGGRVNPHRFTNGMVDAAARSGALVFGDSPVESCTPVGRRWCVRTPHGGVTASNVVLCTNGHAGNAFFPELADTQYPLLACGVATTPLPRSLLDVIDPARVVMSQYPLGLFPLVLDGMNRLVSATIPAPGRANEAGRYFGYLLRYLNRTWPETRDHAIGLEAYWTGITANSAPAYQAGSPRLYRAADGVFALLNFGAGGNVIGPMLGMNLAHALADERHQDLLLPVQTPVSVASPGRFEWKIRHLMIPFARFIDRLGGLRI